jgi:hypothetical protein
MPCGRQVSASKSWRRVGGRSGRSPTKWRAGIKSSSAEPPSPPPARDQLVALADCFSQFVAILDHCFLSSSDWPTTHRGHRAATVPQIWLSAGSRQSTCRRRSNAPARASAPRNSAAQTAQRVGPAANFCRPNDQPCALGAAQSPRGCAHCQLHVAASGSGAGIQSLAGVPL